MDMDMNMDMDMDIKTTQAWTRTSSNVYFKEMFFVVQRSG